MSSLAQQMQASAKLVESLIKELLVPTEPAPEEKPLWEAMEYSTMAGGKRIRPFLVMEVCRTLGGRQEEALIYAAALEMIHTYSLIHDDLPCMDNDDLRRGKPTCHKVFGYANALLAGDALLIRAFETISSSHLSDKTVRQASLALSCSAGDFGMIGGQVIDLRGETESLSYETLLKLHRKKTSAIIRCAALLGCIAAGLEWNDERSEAATAYAENIGLAFQIIDDILDATGDEALLGKPIGSDAESNKTTFLSFFSVDEAYEKASELTRAAIESIGGYEASDALVALANYLLERRY